MCQLYPQDFELGPPSRDTSKITITFDNGTHLDQHSSSSGPADFKVVILFLSSQLLVTEGEIELNVLLVCRVTMGMMSCEFSQLKAKM